MNNIDLICFDLGGVLIRIADGWTDACRHAGIPLRENLDDPDLWEKLQPDYHASEVGLIDANQYINKICLRLDSYTPQEIAAVLDAFLIDLYPGVETFLTRLRQTGITLACLSNTNQRHWETMILDDHSPLRGIRQLDHYFASFQMGARKPDAQIYETFEKSVQVQPGRIVFFDDRPENIAQANQRGWIAHQIDPSNDPPAQMATFLQQRGVLD